MVGVGYWKVRVVTSVPDVFAILKGNSCIRPSCRFFASQSMYAVNLRKCEVFPGNLLFQVVLFSSKNPVLEKNHCDRRKFSPDEDFPHASLNRASDYTRHVST